MAFLNSGSIWARMAESGACVGLRMSTISVQLVERLLASHEATPTV